MTDKLSYALEDGVAVIVLDDGKANAAGFEMLGTISDALARAEQEAAAVALLGRPGVLSGGFDLKVIQSGDEAEINRMVTLGVRTLMQIYGCSRPVVTAATGHAVALGAFMLLASDYRFGCAGDFKIGLNETAIGLKLPLFGIELATARLSPRRLSEAAVMAQLYAPEEAVEVGFLDAVAAPEDLREAVIGKAQEYARLDAEAFAANKLAFRGAAIDRVLSGLEG